MCVWALYFSFPTLLYFVTARYIPATIMRNLVHLEETTGAGTVTPLDRVRRAVWGMLYTDDAGVVSKSTDGLARIMTIIVEVFGEFGLTVSE